MMQLLLYHLVVPQFGARPAKLCCLVSNALAAVCLAAKSAAASPGLCDIADSPTDTVGTAVDATRPLARSSPISCINCGGTRTCFCN